MSIQDELLDCFRRGRLFPLLPSNAGDTTLRIMFVGEGLWKALNSPEGDAAWEQRIGELRADLETFLVERDIYPKYLFLLYHSRDGVWEIRSTGSDPSIRVLGSFAYQDVYVAANFELRENLGGWQSRAWKAVKREARRVWCALFPTYDPIITTDIDDVVTGAVDGTFYKDRG